MRLESLEPKTESEFYTCLRELTLGRVFWERVEPADESGFPDAYFVLQKDPMDRVREGTIELKYSNSLEPNLRVLARGTQKAALLNYWQAGGQRRFALCYCQGRVYLWNTVAYSVAIRGQGRDWSSIKMLAAPDFVDWLVGELTR